MIRSRWLRRSLSRSVRGIPILDPRECPSASSIRETLNILAVIGGLVLVLTITLPASFKDDELFKADERFQAPGYKEYWTNHVLDKGEYVAPSQMFAQVSAFSVIVLLAAVSCSVLLYVTFAYAAANLEGASREDTSANILAWYTTTRWAMVLIIIGLTAGIYLFLAAHWYLYQLKFEDPQLAHRKGEPSSHSLYYRIELASWLLIVPPTVVVFLLGCWANRAVMQEPPSAQSECIDMDIDDAVPVASQVQMIAS